ncbi:hypothetical protein QBC34DRAFT_443501 [Podospora aff. communis PSN243]|uniref:J domain-containing protein n=1 Tax=Podospora aff. communis PSN243 TaxID=3040156 RepID=A0AAV9G3Y7_9PEZI|nr:hypothetical protein QBC34DRAFT_443501 [Podospora aff. communis PSN243]
MVRPKSYHPSGGTTYYEVLGITPSATKAEIRKAFLLTAKKTHPDKHGNTPEANMDFTNVHTAYEILYNQTERAEYDAYLASPKASSGSEASSGPEASTKTNTKASTKANTMAVGKKSNSEPATGTKATSRPTTGTKARTEVVVGNEARSKVGSKASSRASSEPAAGTNAGPGTSSRPCRSTPPTFRPGPRQRSPGSPESDNPTQTSSSSDSSMDPEKPAATIATEDAEPMDLAGRICHLHLAMHPNFDDGSRLKHGQVFVHGGIPKYCLCTPCASLTLENMLTTLELAHSFRSQIQYVRYFTHWNALRTIYRPLRRRRGPGSFAQCIMCLSRDKCNCFDLRGAKRMVLAIAEFTTSTVESLTRTLSTQRARQEAMCPECQVRAAVGDSLRGNAVSTQDLDEVYRRFSYMKSQLKAAEELKLVMETLLTQPDQDIAEVTRLSSLKTWWARLMRSLHELHVDLPGRHDEDADHTGDEIDDDINKSWDPEMGGQAEFPPPSMALVDACG